MLTIHQNLQLREPNKMLESRVRECPICGGDKVLERFNNQMSPLDYINMSYRVGQCSCCGFSFAFELPSEATYLKYYSQLSKYDTAQHKTEFDYLRFDAIANLCARYFSPQSTIVDIGCGEGALLNTLTQNGFRNVYGIEPAPKAIAIAKEKYGITSISKCFFNESSSVAALSVADCVLFSAVLEHLSNIRNDLNNFLPSLKPGCKVIIEVPAIELFSSDTVEPYGELSIEHINFFSRDSLTNLMISLGWRCIHSQYLEYTQFQTGSVTSIFEKSPQKLNRDWLRIDSTLENYLNASSTLLHEVLKKIPNEEFIIYGAGSHSARLLPNITVNSKLAVKAIVDGNHNLIGKTLDEWTVQTPSYVAAMPAVPIVISSFRSQREIAASLRNKFPNPLILLY
jgi:2-polyprenyl-3-methyl-5-hydroxy-6-metoxy-1,4-benzoquinol methylase